MVRFLNILWVMLFFTVYYLIDCMSSSILDNKIPHSILFPHEPLHLLPLKVFGSHQCRKGIWPWLFLRFCRGSRTEAY